MKYTNIESVREVTPLSQKDCFYIADRNKTEFTYPIHTHEEFELNFVAHAAGVRRIVGDSIEIIGEFDLVLITGKDLEHVWEQHKCESTNIREITIQFSQDLFSADLLDKNQFVSIRQMLEKAQKGISFPIEAIMRVSYLLTSLANEQKAFHSVINLFTILYELSTFSDDAKLLSSSSFARVDIHADSRRVQSVQQYINANYNKDIRLDDIAAIVNMTPTAFSRFFKQRSGKTLSDYIIDIRLGYVTRLLVDTSQSISEICYKCGFNNISNFNRIFKKNKKCSPKEFRENYRKKKLLV